MPARNIDNHGPYELVSFRTDGYIIRCSRLAADGKRVIAFLDSKAQWNRFVAALEAGAIESAAVLAIDKEKM